jgi:hypothetical protein
VPRRVSLPGADELFRTTGGMALSPSLGRQQDAARQETARGQGGAAEGGEWQPEDGGRAPGRQRPSGADGQDGPEEHGTAGGSDAGGLAAARRGLGQSMRNGPAVAGAGPAADGPARRKSRNAARRPSGRERHDEKITVYVSAEELMDLEHARLVLRGEHGLAVDRGRIVREAVAVVLADLEQRGEASILVRRLRGR